ncbi:MAG TPA: hypothetical protein VJ972_11055 [Anaerolineales bacterium]|nr:hypothetical protein [Anaerolineales bacterium]
MTQKPQYLTPEGEAKLRTELAQLTGDKRTEIAQRLRSAIQMGDLSENADYHKAKEDQSFLEAVSRRSKPSFAQQRSLKRSTATQLRLGQK